MQRMVLHGEGEKGRMIEIHPLTGDRLDDLARLFETHTATRGCHCRCFLVTNREYQRDWGAENRARFEEFAMHADPPAVWWRITTASQSAGVPSALDHGTRAPCARTSCRGEIRARTMTYGSCRASLFELATVVVGSFICCWRQPSTSPGRMARRRSRGSRWQAANVIARMDITGVSRCLRRVGSPLSLNHLLVAW